MSTQAMVVENKNSLIRTMADKYAIDPVAFKNTVLKSCFPTGQATDEQLALFLMVANKYELNPFSKEIAAFAGKGGGIVPIVMVDGWTTLINRQPSLDGIEFAERHEDGKLVAITCRIYRKDRKMPTEVTEYLSECKRNTDPWTTMPARMLRHKSLIQCARYAFSLSGIYDEDEGRDIADAPRGAIELVSDSPLTRANIPTAPSLKQAIDVQGSADFDKAAQAQEAAPTRLFVNFFVGKDLTRITGQTQPIEKDLKKLFAERSKDGKAWQISAASTDKFQEICEQHNISAIETNEQGEPVTADTGTMADLFTGGN